MYQNYTQPFSFSLSTLVVNGYWIINNQPTFDINGVKWLEIIFSQKSKNQEFLMIIDYFSNVSVMIEYIFGTRHFNLFVKASFHSSL